MSGTEERRAPGASRAPFDGTVEVGGSLGPSFEAQAVNVSEEGMQLRTAYLPELGQQMTCRFDAGSGQTVIASGDVVWSRGGDSGGEFGIRFTEIDPDSVEPLKRACGVAVHTVRGQPGAKVRLYIDGLASPMRAKVRESDRAAVTVGSDLGFLQVGKHLELEDAQSGTKRPATIDRVDVVIDPTSQVPQLVVTLRYGDVAGEARRDATNHSASRAAYPSGEQADTDDASAYMKSAFARHVARVGPSFKRIAHRAKVAATLLMKRSHAEYDAMPRRTTAPPPGGGLHSLGRRVVRGEASGSISEEVDGVPPKRAATKRKAVIAAAVLTTAVAGAVMLKRSHHEPTVPTAVSTTSEPVSSTSTTPLPAPANNSPVSVPAVTQAPVSAPAVASEGSDEPSRQANQKKHTRVTPFGNGPVHHANVLHLKMDGPVESIEGAQQATGFTVKLPGRKSLEAAAPLAARDSRIAAIKVSNDPGGAELNVTFKDGVPNYQVSARGESLIIALAPPGALETTTAKRDDKAAKNPKHGARERDTTPER